MINIVSPDQKRNKKNRTLSGFYADIASSIDYGLKTEKFPVVRHRNTIESQLAFLNYRTQISRPSLKTFQRHIREQCTLYFAGNGNPKAAYTLLMLDIDCLKALGLGSFAGAKAFAEWLEAHKFKGIYWEPSTNKNGVHAYLLIRKNGLGNEYLNSLFKRLERNLTLWAKEQGFDIEAVEVKGTLPVVTFENGKAVKVKCGQLAKFPRANGRLQELLNTTIVDAYDLQKLPLLNDPPKAKTAKTKTTKPKNTTAKVSAAKSFGSISGRHISEQELSNMAGPYRDLGVSLLAKDGLQLSGRAKVTADDVGIFLGLLKFFTENMEANGALPWERFSKMWTALHQSGDISRAFHCSRFAAVRNLLDTLGLIDWKDQTYKVGFWKDGAYTKGRAAKWKASSELMALLTLSAEKDGIPNTTQQEVILSNNKDQDQSINPQQQEVILSNNKYRDMIDGLKQCRLDELTRPEPVYAEDVAYLKFSPYQFQDQYGTLRLAA